MEITRRKFLGSSAAVFVAGSMASRTVFGANERVRICLVGCGGRGGDHIDNYTKLPMSEIVAVVDPDQGSLNARAKVATRKQDGKEVKTFQDLREALAWGEFDAVSIATPHHWHVLAAVWALKAGKHAFVEKPISWSFYEGEQLAAAQAATGLIVQQGAQRRSEARWQRDVALLQSGEIIGKIYMARGLCYKNGNRGSIGTPADAEAPADLNWDVWQGPAQRRAFNKAYHPYSWHWFWDFGNGEIGNQGVHQMNLCAWVMADRGLPVKVFSEGGRYTYQDMGQTPNTNVATLKYADGTMSVFEVRNRFTNTEGGRMIGDQFAGGVDVGNLFYGDRGYYVEGQGFFDEKNNPIPIDESKYPLPEDRNHYESFLRAVLNNDYSQVRGNAMEGHLSAAHCHLANISYRAGQALTFDPAAKQITNHEEANKMLTREYAPGFEVEKFA